MKIFVWPSYGKGRGSGHLKRSLNLVSRLGKEACLLLEKSASGRGKTGRELLRQFGFSEKKISFKEEFDPLEKWDLIILDRKSTALDELKRFSRDTVVLGIDEGGEARVYLPYLIDTLPGINFRTPPNLSSLSLLELPEKRKKSLRFPFRKVLISFGGEDPASLSLTLTEELFRLDFSPPDITLVEGPFFSRIIWPRGISILKNPADLKNLLAEYDLVFTSFGLTCFEALAAGVPVILFNPTRYHRRLSRNSGIPEIGVGRVKRIRLIRYLNNLPTFEKLIESFASILGRKENDVKAMITSIKSDLEPSCPLCRKWFNPVIARYADRTYFRCRRCGLIYLMPFGRKHKYYGEDYFFAEYKKQYGKTYLEDFANIKEAGKVRLKEIKSILSRSAGREEGLEKRPLLLDIGCAYGAFLVAAREEGFEAAGLDISGPAVGYVRDCLQVPCFEGDFEDVSPGIPAPAAGSALHGRSGTSASMPPARFDILTMWFVIEHFKRPDHVLSRVNRLLKIGGIFAFSTPNGKGISALKNMRRFLEQSPFDHYTLMSPSGVRAILKRFGFRLRRLKITGHHAERFPLPGGRRLLGMGDTFEAYAEKVRNLSREEVERS